MALRRLSRCAIAPPAPAITMHPALPATIASILSSAGLGLLAWLGMSIVLLHARADLASALHPLQMCALLIGTVLAAALLAPVPGHHGRSALSSWRTGWSPRAKLLGLATLAIATTLLIVLGQIAPSGGRAMALGALGLLLALSALSAVAAVAMAHTVDGPAPGRSLVLPMHLLFALALGLGLLFLLMAWLLPFGAGDSGMLITLTVLGALLAACLLLYWRDVRRSRSGDGRDRHDGGDRRLRYGSLALLVAVPLACALLARAPSLAAMPWLALTVGSLLCGAMLERWRFFSQPRTR